MKFKLDEKINKIKTEEEMRKEKDSKKKYRLIVLIDLMEMLNITKTSKKYGLDKETVRKWYKKYLENGLEGLEDEKKGPQIKYKLGKIDKTEIENLIKEKNKEGGSITGKEIQEYIIKTKNIKISLKSVYNLLKEMDYSYTSPRSYHPKRNKNTQEDFKKTSKKQLQK